MFRLNIIKNRSLFSQFRFFPIKESKMSIIRKMNPTIYLNTIDGNGKEDDKSRPLVVLMTWLRAKERYIKPYNEFYLNKGFDVMTARITEYDMFYPDYTGKTCLNILESELAHYESILVHGFSFGVYVLATILSELQKRNERDDYKTHLRFEDRIKGIALDSVVTSDHLLEFPDKTLQNLPRQYKYYIKGQQMFLRLHKRTTSYLLSSNEVLFNNPLSVPALVMVSDDDPFHNITLSEKIVSLWRNKDIDVKYRRLKIGHHVKLMKHNKIEYGQLVDELIDQAQINNKIIRESTVFNTSL